MFNKTSISTLIFCAALALGLSGCATTGGGNNAPTAQDIPYSVKPGDSLGEIARRFTGEFNNWEAIAIHNDITDPRTMAAGQVVMIPGNLLIQAYRVDPPAAETSDISDSGPDDNAIRLETNNPTRLPVTTRSNSGVRSARETESSTESNIRSAGSAPPSVQPDPIDASRAVVTTATAGDSQASVVRVIGTYYPKGIYDRPSNNARLIRRVSPGTLFQLEEQLGNWYKIRADESTAYIRVIDSTLDQ